MSTSNNKVISLTALHAGEYRVKSIESIKSKNDNMKLVHIDNNTTIILPDNISRNISDEQIDKINQMPHTMNHNSYRIKLKPTEQRRWFLFFQLVEDPHTVEAFFTYTD